MPRKYIQGVIAFLICLLLAGSSSGDLKIANDPAQVGIGARALGMGGTLLNFSDISSLFGNPASLSNIQEKQFTLMHGKFLNEMDYYSLGAVIPTPLGVVGAAYLSSQLSYTGPVATIEVVDGIRVIPSTTEVATDTYKNSGVYLSFSKPVGEIVKVDFLKKALIGGTFKIYFQELAAAGLSGSAQGYELDLGVQYQINPSLRFSLLGKNVLPASMGGKLVWEPTGREESYPFFVKTGLKFDLERDIEFLEFARRNSFSIGIEYDYHPRGNAPDLMHYGFEWGLGNILDLRLGLDQGYIGRGGTSVFDVSNNMTYGVGVTYQGWRFDYAFHEYYNLSENNTHYFSLTYGLPFKKAIEEPEKIDVSPDRFVTSREEIDVIGRILDKEIYYVLVNEESADIIEGTFSKRVPLSIGRNTISIAGIDRGRREIYSKKLRILRLVGFRDVSEDYWAKNSIETLATLGMIRGYPDQIFKPDTGITRAEFAALLARLAEEEKYQARERLPFKDLLSRHWAYQAIAYCVDRELIKGYPDGTFKPNKKITRAEGVVVIARFAGLDLGAPVYELPYQDVPGRHWAIGAVNAAKNAGLLRYIKENFYPNKELTRAEVAEILSGVSFIKERIDDLLDFRKGY